MSTTVLGRVTGIIKNCGKDAVRIRWDHDGHSHEVVHFPGDEREAAQLSVLHGNNLDVDLDDDGNVLKICPRS